LTKASWECLLLNVHWDDVAVTQADSLYPALASLSSRREPDAAAVSVCACAQWLDESSVAVQEVLATTLERLQQLGATIVDASLPDLEQIQVRRVMLCCITSIKNTSDAVADAGGRASVLSSAFCEGPGMSLIISSVAAAAAAAGEPPGDLLQGGSS
jgi:hypothetical protein